MADERHMRQQNEVPVFQWNIPNLLTILRFAMIGILIWAFVKQWVILAMACYVAAGITDILDGHLARKNHQITVFGKLMDPLADKGMLIAALIGFYCSGMITLPILILVIIKEAMLVIGAAYLLTRKEKVVQANVFGKLTTVLFFAAVMLTFLHAYCAPVDTVLMYAAAILSIVALLQYAYLNMIQPIMKTGKK